MRFSVVGGEGFDQGTDALVCLMEKDEKNEQLENILGDALASLRERKVFEGKQGPNLFSAHRGRERSARIHNSRRAGR